MVVLWVGPYGELATDALERIECHSRQEYCFRIIFRFAASEMDSRR
jgi:hypothetical protein